MLDDLPPRYFDRMGKPIPYEEWSRLTSNMNYKILLKTTIPGSGAWVSTVWLGLNCNFVTTNPPIIFETMVFGGEVEWCERWSTEQEARDGHWTVLIEYLKTYPDAMNQWSANLSQPNYKPTKIDLKILELLKELE